MARTPKKTSNFATGEDVARLAGVSTITVSRVFNAAWAGRIRKETEEKVLAAAAQLKYKPNGVARSLANSRTDIVAVVIGQSAGFFYTDFLMKLVQYIQASGRQTLVYTLDLQQNLDSILAKVSQHRVDAVIVTSSVLRADVAKHFQDIGIPTILFKRSAEYTNLSGVWCDEPGGAAAAARLLLAHGRRKIGVVLHPDGGTHRGDAFIAQLKSEGVEPICVEHGDYTYDAGASAARRMLREHKPDAIFCVEDTMAMACVDVARCEFGLRVPEQLAVIGFDNSPVSGLPAYGLTTVAHPLEDMLEAVVGSIAYLMEHPGAQILRSFPMEILERSTT